MFATLSPQDRTNVIQQLLSRMGITWHAEAKKFSFQDPEAQTFEQFVASIPAKLKTVKILGVNIQNSMEKLRGYAEAVKIADFLENILEQIAEANTRGDLEQQKWKQKLHSAFIYAAADEIRRKKELILPENARKLHTNAVKVFFNEIYLKQQLLGFWFKTMRNRQLAESPVPLIHDLDKLFKRKAKQIEKLDEMRLERNRLLYAAYDKLIKLPDEVKTQVVHMEFDTQIIHRSNSRSYAYPNGENGISELPIIFRLPENRAELDLNQLAEQMAAREIDDADDMDDNE